MVVTRNKLLTALASTQSQNGVKIRIEDVLAVCDESRGYRCYLQIRDLIDHFQSIGIDVNLSFDCIFEKLFTH